MKWLLYGAYGYTGRLVAERAVERGLEPVIAGRDRSRVEALAETLGLPSRVFSLHDPATVRGALEGIDLVLSVAGPFSRTFRPMLEGCLSRECHYLDVTGEIAVLEAAFEADGRAREAGVLLLPGVGFDVVPTDCAAVRAASRVPGPNRLEIAFVSGTRPSRGTLKSQLEAAARPAAVRRGGELEEVPHGSIVRKIPFRDRRRTAVCVPWGDLSTAFRSTGIQEIRTYMVAPPRLLGLARVVRPLLGLEPVRRALEGLLDVFYVGPGAAARRRSRSRVWARVAGTDGEAATVEYVLPDGYTFTARSAVAAVEWILEGRTRRPSVGATTPALLFGEGFADRIDGVERVVG